jgi:DNA-binding LacI/PurR family transcriptional regulator
MPAPARLREVAEATGVDVSTVSRALRGDPRVAASTRAAVAEAAQRLGYRPHRAARQLQAGRTRTLWCVVGALDQPREREPAMHAAQAAAEHGYDLLIATYHDDASRARLAGRLAEGVADGAMVLPLADTVRLSPEVAEAEELGWRDLLHSGFPLCFVDRWLARTAVAAVTNDNAAAGGALVERLVAAGCHRFVNALSRENLVMVDRHRGVEEAAQRLSCTCIAPSAADAAWLSAPGVVGYLANHQAVLSEYLARHPAGAQRPHAGCFDEWHGDPLPARSVIVAQQDFAAMARRAVARLIAACDAGGAVPTGVERLPPLGFEVIRSRV